MSLYINDPGMVPPKAWPEQRDQGFAYKNMETGEVIVAPSRKELFARVKAFNRANNFPVGLDFERQIEEQLCGRLPEGWCTPHDPFRTAEVARPDWPLWAKALALAARPGETGLGDVIARVVGPVGGDAFKAWYEGVFHRSCGCQERQESLNAQYPL